MVLPSEVDAALDGLRRLFEATDHTEIEKNRFVDLLAVIRALILVENEIESLHTDLRESHPDPTQILPSDPLRPEAEEDLHSHLIDLKNKEIALQQQIERARRWISEKVQEVKDLEKPRREIVKGKLVMVQPKPLGKEEMVKLFRQLEEDTNKRATEKELARVQHEIGQIELRLRPQNRA